MRPACVFSRLALAAATAALLASCGGGGGGSGGGASPIGGGAQPVPITESNAKPVSADALSSVRNTSAASGPATLPIGVQVDAARTGGTTLAMLAAARFAAGAARAPLPVGIAMTETVQCPLGGSMTISGNFASTAAMMPGDSFTINAANCGVDESGVTAVMNGQMSITIVSGSMGTPPFRIVLQMTATNLSVTSGGATAVANGDARIDWSAASGSSQTLISSGTSMSTRETVGGTTRNSKMTNYTQGVTLLGTTVSATLAATVETDNPRFAAGGATYVVGTPVPVKWDAATGVVSAGSIGVTGAAGSRLTLDFTGNGNATISLDANGDGTAEKTIATTVAELASLR